jgi:hypothetical protein
MWRSELCLCYVINMDYIFLFKIILTIVFNHKRMTEISLVCLSEQECQNAIRLQFLKTHAVN